MLPVDNAYGAWPLSGKFRCRFYVVYSFIINPGEIDIMEGRGNGPSYPKQYVPPSRSIYSSECNVVL